MSKEDETSFGRVLRPVALAFVLLSTIPVRVPERPASTDWGRSLLAAPLVGLVLGILLGGMGVALGDAASGVASALLLTVWVGYTGALHLDGLADCADAWVGGHGNRERTVDILKDSRAGPVAIVALVVVLIGKFACLDLLLAQQAISALLITPVLGRVAMLGLMARLPYVSPSGLGRLHADHLPRGTAIVVSVGVSILAVILNGWSGLFAVLAAALLVLFLGRSMMRRLGGCTGDTLGASCELVEWLVLLVFVLSPY